MILQGSQRGGAKDLAQHLLKEENEHVEIHELRGFVSGDLVAALNEAYAISKGTKAKQFLFSVSFNPPPEENVTTAEFEAAIERVEKHFGLVGQPRAIVFHEKHGRRHAHTVWSRIDAEKMKAIPLSFTKRDLTQISKDLFIQHGWELPRGYLNAKERNPTNFSMAQWQQAKRTGKDPREIKAVLQDCWATNDTPSALRQALLSRGFYLARGDKRGFVVLDHRAEVYSVAKWTGLKAKDVRGKLDDPNDLPSVQETKEIIASTMAAHLEELKQAQSEKLHARFVLLEQQKHELAEKHRNERRIFREKLEKRNMAENKKRQERFNKGLRGFWDRLTGRHAKLRKENELDAVQCRIRDREEHDALIFKQLDQSRALLARINRLQHFEEKRGNEITNDISQYQEIKAGKRDVFDTLDQRKHEGPKLER